MADERTILITGSTDGLGRETARALAGAGATVLIHGRAPEREHSTLDDLRAFTFDLAQRLEGSGVTVNALHPATLMDTKMVRESYGRSMTSVQQGVEATLHLVSSPELEGESGRFFDGKRESRAEAQAYDRDARRRLWELSERLCEL